MISFDRVSLEYQPERFALEDISFSLEPGSFTYLTGHSGAGKSSLLKLIARLENPSTGEIYAGKIRYSQLNRRQIPALRQQMGIIFQDNQLLNDRTVFDNVAFPLIIGGYKFADIETRVNAALKKVGLSDKAADQPRSLSGGEQQRVGIARAVVARPKILLADEPTGNLDAEISAEIMQLLMQFNASGVTVLIATHDEGLLNTFNFPRLVLKQGRLVHSHDQQRADTDAVLNVAALLPLNDEEKTQSEHAPCLFPKAYEKNADDNQSPPEKRLKASGSKWQYSKRGYALSQSLKQLKRYKMASATTLVVLGVTLALPVILLFASSALQQLGTRSLDGESITAYLNNNISDLQGAELAQQWKGKQGIRSTRYISKDEALQLFRQNSDIGDAISVLGNNPLPGAIMVFPDSDTLNSTRLDNLVTELRRIDNVARIQMDLRWVKRLQSVVSLIQLVGGLLAGFLTLTALLVIGNTIRLELLRRRSEMEVANLLGANNGFMNRPILYTGALYGFLGGIVACLVAVVAFSAIQEPTHELSALYESSFQLLMPEFSQILTVLGVSLCWVLSVQSAVFTDLHNS